MNTVLYILCLVLPLSLFDIIVTGLAHITVNIMYPTYDTDEITMVVKATLRTLYILWFIGMIVWTVRMVNNYTEQNNPKRE